MRLHEVSLDATDDDRGHDPTAGWTARADVMAAVRTLPSEDRALLGLRYGADLAVPDVAAALGIPLGTAKSRLHRALGRLAMAMGDEDGE